MPNVSYCEDQNEVHYNPIDPYNGHAYVDLGLPSGTLWATMNVGANSETDYGLYFQWGDTQGYTDASTKAFIWSDYKWTEDGGSTMTKYNETDSKTVLDLEDDAVATNWGGSWKMPTVEQFQELLDNTNRSIYGNGHRFTSKTDNSKYIFIPDSGKYNEYGCDAGYGLASIWTSSLYSNNVKKAHALSANSSNIYKTDSYNRSDGRCVRGVIG